jgi:hypothetical protein
VALRRQTILAGALHSLALCISDVVSDEEILTKLRELGAGEFAHLNGALISHLRGTYDLLLLWGASQALCRAGLYHVVYGTAGYEKRLLGLERRALVEELLGPASEQLVYLYCACDQGFFWPQIGVTEQPIFRDRFSGEEYAIGSDLLASFCELTVANELEIARGSGAFVREHGASLRSAFARMKPWLSKLSYDSFVEILGESGA